MIIILIATTQTIANPFCADANGSSRLRLFGQLRLGRRLLLLRCAVRRDSSGAPS